MAGGFVPKNDKLHVMHSQRPGVFIAVTEAGVVIEVLALMGSQQVMTRVWETTEWDDSLAKAETDRVDAELSKLRSAPPQQPGPPSQLVQPVRQARPGIVPGTI